MSNVETNRVSTLVANAEGEIDRELLTSTGTGNALFRGYFNDGPLIEQLAPEESLQYLVENRSKGLEIKWSNETETITPTGNYRTAALITDTTTRIVIGQTDGDRVVEIPHSSVTDFSTESSLLSRTLTLTTAEATYRLPTTKDGDVDAIASHILYHQSRISTTQDTTPSRSTKTTQTQEPSTIEPDHTSEPVEREESEKAIAEPENSGSISTTGYWQLPSRDAISTLDGAPTTRIEAARRTLDDDPQASREQLIRAHNDLCRALEYTTQEEAGINTALNAAIDKIESTLPEREAEEPSSESGDPSPSRDGAKKPANVTDTASTSSNKDAPGKKEADDSTDMSVTPDARRSESSKPPSNADAQWRAALLRELQRLDETHDTHVDRELVSRESTYEPVDYDGTFDSFEAALAEAKVDTGSASGETDISESVNMVEEAFDFSKTEAVSETAVENIQPNELAELYEAFGMLQAVIDQLLPHLDPQSETASRKWYQAVYNYWTGEGPKDAPSYGNQQQERNDFSINDYRTQYGDGNRITDFRTIDTSTIEAVARDDLGSEDVAVEAAGFVPVAPESKTPLPIIVRTDTELANARELLEEFPAYPEANTPPPGSTEETQELPEGRVDEVTVTVLDEYPGSGSKRDAWLSVRTDTGQRMPLVIWTTHEIDAEWEVGATYTLYEARHKQWTSDGSTTHELSSTSDLTIIQTGEPDATTVDGEESSSQSPRQSQSKRGEEQTTERDESAADTDDTPAGLDSTTSDTSDPPEPAVGGDAGDDDEQDESDESGGIVEQVLNDIDL